jgi:N-acetylglucosamine-6-phosphate deacetylase
MLNDTRTPDRVSRIVAGHRSRGTTSLLPTLISDTREVQQAGIDAVRAARAAGNPGVLGIHIEGPFFNPQRRGAHSERMIRRPQANDIDWLLGEADLPLLVTLAPEQAAAGQIRAGHTDASAAEIHEAVKDGLRGFTHLFNAMSPLHSREPGVVGQALSEPDTWAGIIADGHHVHPTCLALAHRAKGAGKLFLVSDAMATVGSEQQAFDIYGERILERDGALVNGEGVLAGSAIALIDAVRYMHQSVGLDLGECLKMASRYPADFLDIADWLGSLGQGKRADLVCFDARFEVVATWVAGQPQDPNYAGQESPS